MLRHETLEAGFLKDDIAINLKYQFHQDTVDLHKHAFYELVIVQKGQGIHFTHDQQYAIRSGDVFLLKPGSEHGYKHPDQLVLTNVFYLPDRLDLPFDELAELPGYHALFEFEPEMRNQHGFKSRLQLTIEQLEHVDLFLQRMVREIAKKETGYRFMTLSLFAQLLFFLSKSYQKIETQHSYSLLRLGHVISYIRNHYHEQIPLEKLTHMAKMSQRSFIRHFKVITKMTPLEYIIKQRIAKAASLLVMDMSLSEIASVTGFKDSNYLSRQFKKVTGLSPRDYKKLKL